MRRQASAYRGWAPAVNRRVHHGRISSLGRLDFLPAPQVFLWKTKGLRINRDCVLVGGEIQGQRVGPNIEHKGVEK